MLVPVYDIKNCGPRHRFAANGKLVHNSDSINMQNLPRKSPLKKTIAAPEGYWIVDCDSSQIEARTLAWLAGQDDLVEAFERGEDVYRIMAAKIYGKEPADITKDERFAGKTVILGCLAEGTLVLTDRGWVAIEEVTTFDQLWDGEEWVCHQGLVKKGTKETLNLCGLWLTPDHKVLCGTQWLEAQSVAQDRGILSLALDTGAVSWSSPGTSRERGAEYLRSSSNAVAGDQNIPSIRIISKTSKVLAAPCVVGGKGTENAIGNIAMHFPIPRTGSDCSTGFLRPSAAATYPPTGYMQTMEVEASPYASYGEPTALSSCATPKLCRDGIIPNSTWTASTTTEGTNPVISGLSRGQITKLTEERSVSFRRNLMTYDIAFAGPRNRYTIATSAGPIIVHNCGYGMGALKFQAQLKTFNVQMPLDECKRIIAVYRETYPMIPRLWREASEALDAMANNQTAPYGRDGVLTVAGEQGVYLPNGFRLQYPNLRWYRNGEKTELIYDTKKGKAVIPKRIWGGASVENVCQALARIAIGGQMLRIAKKYRVVMTVHDSVVSLVPEAEVEEAKDYIMRCMRMRPAWAPALPLNCEAKAGATYGG